MPTIEAQVTCPVHESFRVAQVAGMFDVEVAAKSQRTFAVELPELSEPWQVGAIVGPSGSGKSTIARHAYGAELYAGGKWPKDKAVLDGFPARLSARSITAALTAVGFSSPPAWIRPYHVLSNGEKFRADLARALLTGGELVVYDEFTSVVDRTVAKIGSYAVAKAIRKGAFAVPPDPPPKTSRENPSCDEQNPPSVKRFVAVTCHYDVLDWLEPDWVLDMSRQELARGYLRRRGNKPARPLYQRPPIELEIVRCHHSAWKLFGPHHYLNASCNRSAWCYVGLWENEPVAFAAFLPNVGKHQHGRRVSRIVVLPDYQGAGIGGRFLDAVAGIVAAEIRDKVNIITSHPAMIAYCKRSPAWRCRSYKLGDKRDKKADTGETLSMGRKRSITAFTATRSYGRATASFVYVPPNC